MSSKILSRLALLVAFSAAVWCVLPAGAQQRATGKAPPKQSVPARQPSTQPAKPAPRPAAAPNDPERQAVLQSKAWNEAMHEFNEWLSVQSLYDAQQVQSIKARLDAGVARMTATELQAFLVDLQGKMAVLTSQQAQDAQAFVAETLAVASPAYAKRIKSRLPDVLTMTSAQIQQQLAIFAQKRSANQQAQKAFTDARQQQIQYNQAQLKAQQQEQEEALNRAVQASEYAGQSNITPARDYFPEVGQDNMGYMLPFYGGFGWGGGGVVIGGGRR